MANGPIIQCTSEIDAVLCSQPAIAYRIGAKFLIQERRKVSYSTIDELPRKCNFMNKTTTIEHSMRPTTLSVHPASCANAKLRRMGRNTVMPDFLGRLCKPQSRDE